MKYSEMRNKILQKMKHLSSDCVLLETMKESQTTTVCFIHVHLTVAECLFLPCALHMK